VLPTELNESKNCKRKLKQPTQEQQQQQQKTKAITENVSSDKNAKISSRA